MIFYISSIRDSILFNQDSEICFTYPSRNEMVNIFDNIDNKEFVPEIPELYGKNFKFSFSPNSNADLYPFDKYDVQLEIMIVGNGKPTPNFEIRLRDNISDLEIINFEKHSNLNFSFQFVRSRFIRFFTLFIYIVAFISLLFIGFKQSIKDILFQGFGYLLALWAIRDIITGNLEYFPTIIDYITIILITLLILIIIGRLLNDYYDNKSTLPNIV